MKKIVLLLVFTAFCLSSIFAQESDDFKPSGKPFVKIFTNYHSTFYDGAMKPAFELTRSYFGYNYKFSENISGKLTLDVGNPKMGDIEYVAYLKNAKINYKNEKILVSFGMIGLYQYKIMEKTRGHRYINKSFQDKYKFGTSADIGMHINYKFHKMISADFTLTNGEGYKKLQNDSSLKVAFGLTLNPIEGLSVRGYYDYVNKEIAQTSLSGFVGYMSKKFAIGAEYNVQNNHDMVENYNFAGYSFSSAYQFTKKLEVFVRYDNLYSDEVEENGVKEAWNIEKDGQAIMFGIEFTPFKNIKIAPNFQGFQSAGEGSKYQSNAYISLEIVF